MEASEVMVKVYEWLVRVSVTYCTSRILQNFEASNLDDATCAEYVSCGMDKPSEHDIKVR